MGKQLSITVTYQDGTQESFRGGLHFTEAFLCIYPRRGKSTRIPLPNIKKVDINDQEEDA